MRFKILIGLIGCSGMLLSACQLSPPQATVSQLPVIEEFTSDPPSVLLGYPSILKWTVTGATEISIDHGIGKVYPYATRVIFPTENTTYTLTATNGAGTVTRTTTVAACLYCGCFPWGRLSSRPGYEVYLDTVNCFTLRYPSAWIIDKERFATLNSLSGGVLFGVSFSNNRTGGDFAYFDILIEDKEPDFNLLNFAARYKDMQQKKGFTIVSETAAGGGPPNLHSIVQTYKYMRDNRNFDHLVWFRPTGYSPGSSHRLWTIKYEGAHDIELEKMFESLRFLGLR